MDEQRDKLPAQESADETPEKTPAAIPEESQVIEILDDAAEPEALPFPGPERIEADFPEEALQQIRTLRAQMERKDRQIEQVMEAYRSTKAETEKQRERISKTERRRFEQSKGDFIARFVEVLDNLDRAIDSIEQSFDADSVLQGIMLVRSRLVQLLKTEGLEKIFVRGQPFDPMHSEAAEMEPVGDEMQDGVVVKELQPGYMLKGSLLRAARVVVGQYGSGDSEDSDPGTPRHALPKAAERIIDDTEEMDPVSPVSLDDDSGEDGDAAREDDWETDEAGHELQFTEDGFDFSKD